MKKKKKTIKKTKVVVQSVQHSIFAGPVVSSTYKAKSFHKPRKGRYDIRRIG